MIHCCSNGQSCHSFHLLSEKDARIAFPTVQELLEHSCAQEQIKFKQVLLAVYSYVVDVYYTVM